MLANWEAMLAGIPGFCAGICRSVQDGDRTWTEWRWSGTRSDGQAFEMRGVTLFEVTGGQIAGGRLYLEDVERDVAGIEQAVQDLSGRRPRTAHQQHGAAPPASHRPSGRGAGSSACTCRAETLRALALRAHVARNEGQVPILAATCCGFDASAPRPNRSRSVIGSPMADARRAACSVRP
jgi:hypothetical protein